MQNDRHTFNKLKACFIPAVMADKRALERDQTNGMFRARQLSKIAHLAVFPNSCSTHETLARLIRGTGSGHVLLWRYCKPAVFPRRTARTKTDSQKLATKNSCHQTRNL